MVASGLVAVLTAGLKGVRGTGLVGNGDKAGVNDWGVEGLGVVLILPANGEEHETVDEGVREEVDEAMERRPSSRRLFTLMRPYKEKHPT